MKRNPYQVYEQNSVTTASPGELTLMLYDGCLKFMRQGKMAILNKQIEAKNAALINAQNIIRELIANSNPDVPISKEFVVLYDFILRRLIHANLKMDVVAVEEGEKILTEIRDAWKEMLKNNRKQNGQYTVNGGRA
jgi:flagellar secretion chaperone FliS